MIGSRKAAVIVAVGLLAGPALAGCLEDKAGGNPGSQNASESGSGDGALDKSTVKQKIRESLPMATEGQEDKSDLPARVSIEGSVTNDSGTVSFGLLVDKPDKFMAFSMDMKGLSKAGSTTPSKGTFIMGQHGKVTTFGFANETSTGFAAWYNKSADPVDELDEDTTSANQPGQGSSSPFGDVNPTKILENVTERFDGNASWSISRVQHEGRPAVEAHVRRTKEGATYEVTAVVWTDAERIAKVNGSIEAEDPSTLGEGVSEGTFTFEFAYGDDASHEYAKEVRRAASLAFKDQDDLSAFGGGDEASKSYTVKPTPADGIVPLEKATAIVSGSSGVGSSDDGKLRMPLEDGSASAGDVRATFEDVDGDGLVSPGDQLGITALGDGSASSYSLTLLDEVTGVKVSPGVPAAALLAAVGGLAALAGRRRS